MSAFTCVCFPYKSESCSLKSISQYKAFILMLHLNLVFIQKENTNVFIVLGVGQGLAVLRFAVPVLCVVRGRLSVVYCNLWILEGGEQWTHNRVDLIRS